MSIKKGVKSHLGMVQRVTKRKEYTFNELKSLTTLDLAWTKVKDADLVHLKELKSLKTLNLMYTQVTDADLSIYKELKSLQ